MSFATRTAGVIGSIALTAGLGVASAGPANAQGPVGGEGEVTANGGLSLRYPPSTKAKRVGSWSKGDKIPLVCKVRGTTVGGNDIWYSVPVVKTQWVSARYVRNVGRAPGWCTDSNTVGRINQPALIKRAGPTTSDKRTGTIYLGQKVDLICKVKSEDIRGNKLWYQTADRQWITARYVDNVGRAPSYC